MTNAESARAADGTVFGIASEQIRGERRFYFIVRYTGQRWVPDDTFDGSYDKRTALSRMRRAAEQWEGDA